MMMRNLIFALAFALGTPTLADEETFKYLGADMRAWVEGTKLDKIGTARVAILAFMGPASDISESDALEAFVDEAQKMSDDVVSTLIENVYPRPDDRSENFLEKLECRERLELITAKEPVLFFTFATLSGRSCIASFGQADHFVKLLYDIRNLEQVDCLNQPGFKREADARFYQLSISQEDDRVRVSTNDLIGTIADIKKRHCI